MAGLTRRRIPTTKPPPTPTLPHVPPQSPPHAFSPSTAAGIQTLRTTPSTKPPRPLPQTHPKILLRPKGPPPSQRSSSVPSYSIFSVPRSSPMNCGWFTSSKEGSDDEAAPDPDTAPRNSPVNCGWFTDSEEGYRRRSRPRPHPPPPKVPPPWIAAGIPILASRMMPLEEAVVDVSYAAPSTSLPPSLWNAETNEIPQTPSPTRIAVTQMALHKNRYRVNKYQQYW